ncbi:MAG TPA: glycosyltransferase family 87 protein [Candidatus Dormibacteraeota bacterium]|nr:glycosyltransferase family 87 protein [Candidatus Dormibacteraeota bacterium]
MASACGCAVQSPAIQTAKQTLHPGAPSRHYTGLVWLFVAAMLATHAFFFWSVRDRIARGDPDFTVFYTAGKILREGRGAQLYDAPTQQTVQREFATDSDIRRGPLPYIHPPFEALFFLPLTFLPYSNAFVLWNLLNLGMLFVIAGLMKQSMKSLRQVPVRQVHVRQIKVWQIVSMALAFFPIFANFHQGQDAILLLLVGIMGFRALDKDAEFLAGCWLGFGLFKYHLILPLALILAIWKGKKFALGFIAVGAAVVLISLGLVGWRGALAYPAYAWQIVSEPRLGGIPARQLPNLLGLLGGWRFSGKVGWPVELAVMAGSAALLVISARMRDFANDQRYFRLCFAGAVIVALLVGYSTNSYDLSLLVLPLAVAADHCLAGSSEEAATKVSLIVPAIPLLISPIWFFLWMRWESLNLMAIFLLWWAYAIRNEILRLQRQSGGLRPGAQLA